MTIWPNTLAVEADFVEPDFPASHHTHASAAAATSTSARNTTAPPWSGRLRRVEWTGMSADVIAPPARGQRVLVCRSCQFPMRIGGFVHERLLSRPCFGHALLHSGWKRGMGRGGASKVSTSLLWKMVSGRSGISAAPDYAAFWASVLTSTTLLAERPPRRVAALRMFVSCLPNAVLLPTAPRSRSMTLLNSG